MKYAVAIWVLLATFANGDVLLLTDAGAWVSTVDANGKPTWTKLNRNITHIEDARTGTPNPKPDPDPDPTPPSTIAISVEKWAREVADPTTALGLAEVYRIGAQQLREGLTDEQSLKLVSLLTDEVLRSQEAEAAWQPWRTKVTGVIVTERGKGTYGPDTLEAIEAGLRASADGQAINPDNLEKLLAFILQILPIILRLLGL